jgi:preprotein translocase subunit SecB
MSDIPSTQPSTPADDRVGTLIIRHYLHDLSVENPAGRVADADISAMLSGMDGGVTAARLDAPNQHLVSIHLLLTSKLGERVVFLMELTYRVEVEMFNLSGDVGEFALAVSVPEAIFPVIQELVKINGSYAGYPEMEVAPPNFHALFANRKAA